MEKKRYEIKPRDRFNSVTDKKYRMNSLLIKQLDIFVNFVEYDSDVVLLIDGEIEGSGKSTLAQQVGYYFSNKTKQPFGIEQIVFTPKQFKDAVMSAPRFSCVVWDEAYAGANKFRIMAAINQTIISTVQQIRQRNLFIILVLPSFFDLTKYFAVRRSWCLLHCYLQPQIDIHSDDKLDFNKPVLQRGYFKYFSRPAKKRLYNKGKKDEDYDLVKPNFVGMFPADYTVPEDLYKAKKAEIDTEQEKMSERTFIEECLHRGMEIPTLQRYTSYAREYLYQIRRKLGL